MSVQCSGLHRAPRRSRSATGATFGTKLLGLQRVDKSASSMAFRMDDRKQRIIVDAGWRRRASASSAGRSRTPPRWRRLAAKLEARRREGRARLARARRRAAREGPDRAGRTRSATASRSFTAPRWRPMPFPPGRIDLGLPHRRRSAWAMWCCSVETCDAVMPFYRDLLGFRLSDYYHKPFQRLFHARQSAPPQPRVHRRSGKNARASHDDGAVLSRRRRAGLRHRAERKRIASPSRSAATPATISPRSISWTPSAS